MLVVCVMPPMGDHSLSVLIHPMKTCVLKLTRQKQTHGKMWICIVNMLFCCLPKDLFCSCSVYRKPSACQYVWDQRTCLLLMIAYLITNVVPVSVLYLLQLSIVVSFSASCRLLKLSAIFLVVVIHLLLMYASQRLIYFFLIALSHLQIYVRLLWYRCLFYALLQLFIWCNNKYHGGCRENTELHNSSCNIIWIFF
jgi:hypothetical protein